ncbi:MAG: hypothetical protein KDB29_07235 [Planctomycetes bacterium]|nr:hypothetical protein [Planctomycetota bacterium]
MIGFKVLTKQGLKGPFKKSSILKAITSAEIPLQARLLDLETGRYLSAAELVGEQEGGLASATVKKPNEAERQELSDIHDHVTDDSGELRLDEETGSRD